MMIAISIVLSVVLTVLLNLGRRRSTPEVAERRLPGPVHPPRQLP